MSLADCTGTAVPVTELAQPASAGGWPEALSSAAPSSYPSPSQLAAIAKERERELGRAFRNAGPMPRALQPELRLAIASADDVRHEAAVTRAEWSARQSIAYKIRDSEDLKKARRAAQNAVPFPPELIVPIKKGTEKTLLGLTEHFSDGSSKYLSSVKGDDPQDHCRLEYMYAAIAYYEGDEASCERACSAIHAWQTAKEEAADRIGDFQAAEAYAAEARRPMREAARRRDAVERAILSVRPQSPAEVMAKARAAVALDFGKITDAGVVLEGYGSTWTGVETAEQALKSIWPDLRRMAAKRTTREWVKAFRAAGGSFEREPVPPDAEIELGYQPWTFLTPERGTAARMKRVLTPADTLRILWFLNWSAVADALKDAMVAVGTARSHLRAASEKVRHSEAEMHRECPKWPERAFFVDDPVRVEAYNERVAAAYDEGRRPPRYRAIEVHGPDEIRRVFEDDPTERDRLLKIYEQWFEPRKPHLSRTVLLVAAEQQARADYEATRHRMVRVLDEFDGFMSPDLAGAILKLDIGLTLMAFDRSIDETARDLVADAHAELLQLRDEGVLACGTMGVAETSLDFPGPPVEAPATDETVRIEGEPH